MKENRNIDRKMLASFIEYAIERKVMLKEWGRFIVRRYQDEEMEEVRLEFAKLLCGYGEAPPDSQKTKDILYEISGKLHKKLLLRKIFFNSVVCKANILLVNLAYTADQNQHDNVHHV